MGCETWALAALGGCPAPAGTLITRSSGNSEGARGRAKAGLGQLWMTGRGAAAESGCLKEFDASFWGPFVVCTCGLLAALLRVFQGSISLGREDEGCDVAGAAASLPAPRPAKCLPAGERGTGGPSCPM